MPPIKQNRPDKLEPWQDPNVDPYIQLEGLTKNYGKVPAVKDITLNIYRGEFFSLLGASGCGKSTLLRMLAGLEHPTSGRILIDGVDVTNVPAYERPVNMMFQSYALFPHMTVYQNVAFGLEMDGISKSEITERVHDALSLVNLREFKDRKPGQLSGGQRQRVALVRSLVKRPKLILLDEPLGALDKRLREKTQFELVNIQEKVGITFIMVTHDQEEAMTMSTRIGVMEEGRIRQIGLPHEIYEYPNSRHVAEFIGSINIFDGIVTENEKDHILIESSDIESPIYVNQATAAPMGSNVSVAVRPEKVLLSTEEPKQTEYNYTRGIVKEIAYLGDMSIFYVELESGKLIQSARQNLLRLAELDIQWDDAVYLYWSPESGVVLNG